VKFVGHAIECRINAEDPDRDFQPSPGLVAGYVPAGGPGVRIDSHVEAGYRIPPFYDSLIAKVVCWGSDRPEAIARMQRALAEMRVEGVKTTIPLHMALIGHERFRSGDINTGFVAELIRK
jgi:acetyl-CoA carboxylase biotin carboxylase subunit